MYHQPGISRISQAAVEMHRNTFSPDSWQEFYHLIIYYIYTQKRSVSLCQSSTGVTLRLGDSGPSQPTPRGAGAHPGPSTPSQPLTGIRGSARAVATTGPSGLRRRSQLRCYASDPFQAGPRASCTAARDSQVKCRKHTHTNTHARNGFWDFVWMGVVGTAAGGGLSCKLWLLVFWESLVHDCLMILFLACPPPPLALSSPLSPSIFLQQKTSGCSQPTDCRASFRALPA